MKKVSTQSSKAKRSKNLVSTPPVGPVVGIGTSAGGLPAMEKFFAKVPKNSGLAFVVVQHLDPTHKGMLVELLHRFTRMPVFQIMDSTRILPNRVHVIPPDCDLAIADGVLYLKTPKDLFELRNSIDHFFQSLAEDQGERAIGVILSGMGNDGTLGVKCIKELSGMTFAQSPDSADFGSMPRSAIEAGVVDCVADAEDLPTKILEMIRSKGYAVGGFSAKETAKLKLKG